MGRSKVSAADYIEQQSTYVGVILAELAEHAALANRAWLLAVDFGAAGRPWGAADFFFSSEV